MKKKHEEEKKLRELEIFGVNHKFAPELENKELMPKKQEVNAGQFTVPQPFELSTGVKTEERKQRAMALERERYLNECTFKP